MNFIFFFVDFFDEEKKRISMKRFSDAAYAAAHGASRHKSSSLSLSSRVCDLLKVKERAGRGLEKQGKLRLIHQLAF